MPQRAPELVSEWVFGNINMLPSGGSEYILGGVAAELAAQTGWTLAAETSLYKHLVSRRAGSGEKGERACFSLVGRDLFLDNVQHGYVSPA
jgi:hypothetical protein